MVDLLSREIMAANRDPEFRTAVERIGVDPIVHTPAEFAQTIAAEAVRWRDLIREMGIKPQ